MPILDFEILTKGLYVLYAYFRKLMIGVTRVLAYSCNIIIIINKVLS